MRQYPFVYALQNDENLDYDNERSKQFDAKMPRWWESTDYLSEGLCREIVKYISGTGLLLRMIYGVIVS